MFHRTHPAPARLRPPDYPATAAAGCLAPRNGTAKRKSDHGQILRKSVCEIHVAPENNRLYQPIDPAAPDIQELAQSLLDHGVQEPLVISADGFLLSGHRRRAAAIVAELSTVPCRVMNVRRDADPDKFLKLLREFNRQRVKTREEALREEVLDVDPDDAHRALSEFRSRRADLGDVDVMELRERRDRAKISSAKLPMLSAIKTVLDERRDFWPLSDRQIHYALLNDPPLIHASKPDSIYANDKPSYRALTDLLTRARLEGQIGWDSIADETRTVTTWCVCPTVQQYLDGELGGLFKGYWRDLLQSQPNQIEIVGEKNTLHGVIRPIAMRYCIPYTLGRGFSSSPPRRAMTVRFRKSGKHSLIVLILSDHDPDGECIAESFARSMRDEFHVQNIIPVRVALKAQQVAEYKLTSSTKAKPGSSRYKQFVKQFGEWAYELESLPPATLAQLLETEIEKVLDLAAYNSEVQAEREDAAFLAVQRRRVLAALGCQPSDHE